jgi:hypothetical protein
MNLPKQRIVIDPTNHQKAPLNSLGTMRADDGNRTLMASLEGVWRVAVKAAELGGSLFRGDRG